MNRIIKISLFTSVLFLILKGGFSQTLISQEGTDSIMFYTNGAKSMVLTPDGKLRIGTEAPTTASAVLQLNSTSGGLLIPRLNLAQRTALTNPVEGLLIYNTTSKKFNCYSGGSWNVILSGLGNLPSQIQDADGNTKVVTEGTTNSDTISFYTAGGQRMVIDNLGYVGIGTSSPATILDIQGNVGGVAKSTATGTNPTNIGFYGDAYGGSVNIGIYGTSQSSISTDTAYGGLGNITVTGNGFGAGLTGVVNTTSSSGVVGVQGISSGTGNGSKVGVSGRAVNKDASTPVLYGGLFEAEGEGGTNNTGIYASAKQRSSGTSGVFAGGTFTVNTLGFGATTMGVYAGAGSGINNYAGYFDANGTGTNNYGLYVNAINATGSNRAAWFDNGNVLIDDSLGIGTVPEEKLHIAGPVMLTTVTTPATTTNRLYNVGGNLYWNGTQLDVTGGTSQWTKSGTTVYNTTLTDNIAIGVNSAGAKLDVHPSVAYSGILAQLQNDNSGSGSTVFNVVTNGSGNAINVSQSGWGRALYLDHTNSSNTVAAAYIQTSGNGNKALELNHTGGQAGSTDYALHATSTGAGTANVAGYFTAFGATNNYAGIFDQGNVGIGTTTPSEKLHLQNGVFMMTTVTAPATTTDKLYNVGGNLFWNGTQLDAGGGSSPWSKSGTTIFNTTLTDAVGIGTSSPASQLELESDGGAGITLDAITNITNDPFIQFKTNGFNRFRIGVDNDDVDKFKIYAGVASPVFTIDGAQNVGIGTTNPNATLDINNDGGTILIPRKSTTGDPAGGTNGMIYYNEFDNRFRIYESGAWNNMTSVAPNSWLTAGNSGTVDGTDFIGSIDNVALTLKVNSVKAGRIESDAMASGNYSNTILGYSAGFSNTTGSQNTFIGVNAGKSSSTAQNVTALGFNALRDNTGGENLAVGVAAAQGNTTGIRNTAIGFQTLLSNTTSSDNTAVGHQSLTSTTGSSNTGVGRYTLYSNNTGYQNTAIGTGAGQSNTTGYNNTFLGYGSDASVGTIFNSTAVGANVVLAQSNSVILGNSANVGIGTNTPSSSSKLHVVGSSNGSTVYVEDNALTNGSLLYLSSTATTGTASNISKMITTQRSGANANSSHTAYGLYSTVTNTGTTSTNIAGYFSASGATNNYAAIFANGYVGVGTTSPQYNMQIHSPTTNSYLNFTNPSTGETSSDGFGIGISGTDALLANQESTGTLTLAVNGINATTINSSGNVGINNTNPNYSLDVSTPGLASTSEGIARFGVSDATSSYLLIRNFTSTDASYTPGIDAYRTGGGNSLIFRANSNNDAGSAAVIAFNAQANGTSPSFRPLFDFQSNGTSKMVIDQNGNVGIGVSPASTLDVKGDISVQSDADRLIRSDEGADLLPLCYAVISAGGVIQTNASISNISVVYGGTGTYVITYTGGSRTFSGYGEVMAIVTPIYSVQPIIANYTVTALDEITVQTFDLGGSNTDTDFSIMIYVK